MHPPLDPPSDAVEAWRGRRPRFWHAVSAEAALADLGSSSAGLTGADAQRRLAIVGANALTPAPPVPIWRIAVDQFRSVVVLLLVAAMGVASATGDWLDAGAIFAVLIINAILGFALDLRARRAIEALFRLDVPSATVVRDGVVRDLDAREIVPGDVLVLEAGQHIAADARLLAATELRVIEASLTGESMPAAKHAEAVLEQDTPLADRANMVYKATSLAAGAGRAVVVATGAATEIGRIGVLVSSIGEERTPLERRLDALGRRLVGLAGLIALVIVGLGLAQGRSVGDMVLTGLAVAVAAVPEGLPMVATITLAIGVHRMARRLALVRRLPAVETLGSVTVICTDKTGTLTTGVMTVTDLALGERRIHIGGAGYVPEGDFHDGATGFDPLRDAHAALALRVGALASTGDCVRTGETWIAQGDPTDVAFVVAARKAGLERAQIAREWPEAATIPFSSERLFMSSFRRTPAGTLFACVKGAPARVLVMCDRQRVGDAAPPLDDAARRAIEERNRDMAGAGLRVLALAGGPVAGTDDADLRGLTFIALAGLIDPAAPGVAQTVQRFRDAGIRVVMLTGDQRLTADAVARGLGIVGPGDLVVDGRELGPLSKEALHDTVGRAAAFSRVSPEAKLRIVSSLQAHGEIVAMLGDGINDAAALKKADVGVAMGRRGTDVAKEAADVILQDDRFETIGTAIEEGRVIFANIRKFVFYLFSCNLAEVLVLLAAGTTGLPLPLLPLQILWLNLLTDTFPALALSFEPADPDVMTRRPHDSPGVLLSAPFLASTTFYATLITLSTLAALVYGLQGGGDHDRVVTLSFMTLALAQTFHLGNARSSQPVLSPRRAVTNPWAVGAVLLVVALQLLTVHWAPLARVLHTQPIDPTDWAVIAGLAALPALVGQIVRLVTRGRRRPASRSAGASPVIGVAPPHR